MDIGFYSGNGISLLVNLLLHAVRHPAGEKEKLWVSMNRLIVLLMPNKVYNIKTSIGSK